MKSLTDRFTRLYQNSKGSGYGLMDSTYEMRELGYSEITRLWIQILS